VFSYFQNGIEDIVPQKNIDFNSLVNVIRTNPCRNKIEKVRQLKRIGDKRFEDIKRSLPNITPHCLLKVREFNSENLLSMSGYIYFDLDKFPDAHAAKERFINELSDVASLICVSTGGDGVSILFKSAIPVTDANYLQIREAIQTKYLHKEILDNSVKNIGRAMFISYDPDVFVSYSNEVVVDIHPNSCSSLYNISTVHLNKTNKTSIDDFDPTYKIYNISTVLNKIQTATYIPVNNPIVDFREEEYVNVYIPKVIHDTKKHKTYYRLIHQLYYLNPNVESNYIFSYLVFVNNTRAKPKMDFKELWRFFNSVWDQIKKTGDVIVAKTIKRVHFNPAANLTAKQKLTIAANINAVYKRHLSIQKINDAKEHLLKLNQRITNSAIAKYAGISTKTVSRYFKMDSVDMVYELSLWN